MRILITGGGGMLAQALVPVFATEDVRVMSQEELDITDRGAVMFQAGSFRPNLIINAAAYTAVDRAETEREQAHAVNADGVRNVAEVAREIGASVVHYSTDYVFPGTSKDGYAEDHVPGPAVNVYGESKLAGEQALAAVGGRYYILRTAWLYGAGGRNFVDTMLGFVGKREEVAVVDDQRGNPTYTKDVAMATLNIINDTTYAPGIYHIVNEGVVTWYELAQEVFSLAGVSLKVVPVSHRDYVTAARRPETSWLQNTRGPKMRPWQEALEDYIKTKQKQD